MASVAWKRHLYFLGSIKMECPHFICMEDHYIYLTTDNKDNVLRANGIVYQVLANHFKTKS